MAKFLLLFLLCFGCSEANIISVDLDSTFVVDSSFSQDEQAQIVKALWNWEQATKGIVNMKLIVTDTLNLYSEYPKIIKSEEWIPSKLGYTNSDYNHTDIYLYYRVIYTPELNSLNVSMLSIAEHEMGHAFGLHHAEHGIMTAAAIEQQCIDTFALEHFCDIHNCSMSDVQTNCPSNIDN